MSFDTRCEHTSRRLGRDVFTCLSRSDTGRSFELHRDGVIIGRDDSAGVQLRDVATTLEHGRIDFEHRRWVIRPLNGDVEVNGLIISDVHELRIGEVIHIGQSLIACCDDNLRYVARILIIGGPSKAVVCPRRQLINHRQ